MDWLRARLKEAMAPGGQSSGKLYLSIFAIVIVAAVAITVSTSNSSSGVIEPSVVPSTLESSQQQSQPSLYIHIVGAIKSPGIYKLELGSRVVDAVFAAGGFLRNADQASLNLARELSDGEQLIALEVGQSVSAGQGAVRNLISLNLADQSQLEQLPGVGPALAGRLIDWRSSNGGFKSKNDLLSVSGIGKKLFDGIKDLVTL